MTFRYRWRRFYGAAVCRERKRPIGAGAVAVFTSQCAAFVFCFVVFWRMRRIEGRWAQRNRVPKISNNKGRADARVLQWPRSPHCNWNNNPKFNNNSIPYQQIVDAKLCRSMAPRRFFPSVAQVSTLHRLAAELSVGEKRCFAYLSGWADAAIECGLPLGPVKV